MWKAEGGEERWVEESEVGSVKESRIGSRMNGVRGVKSARERRGVDV